MPKECSIVDKFYMLAYLGVVAIKSWKHFVLVIVMLKGKGMNVFAGLVAPKEESSW